jgi:hypothetical protein
MNRDVFVDVQIVLPRDVLVTDIIEAFKIYVEKKAAKIERNKCLNTLLEGYVAELALCLLGHCAGTAPEEVIRDHISNILKEAKSNFEIATSSV